MVTSRPESSSVIEEYVDLARSVVTGPPRLGGVRLVSVDGPSGSGKSTFVKRLASAVEAEHARVSVLRTDDLLDGWSDIVHFWPRLESWILGPIRRGDPGHYRVYDWHAGRFEDTWHTLDVPDVLVLDGVTSARREVLPELTLGVFVVAPDDVRLRRGVDRDGERLRPRLERWMEDEAAHFAVDGTSRHVDLIVNGAPRIAYDPEREYVRTSVA